MAEVVFLGTESDRTSHVGSPSYAKAWTRLFLGVREDRQPGNFIVTVQYSFCLQIMISGICKENRFQFNVFPTLLAQSGFCCEPT